MNHYARDSYHVHLFDLYGTKQETHVKHNYLDAVTLGYNAREAKECASLAVSRVLFNSLDGAEDFLYKMAQLRKDTHS